MKTVRLLIGAFVLLYSAALFAQNKNEMPFGATPEVNKLLRQAWVMYGDVNFEEGNKLALQASEKDPACGMAYISTFAPTIQLRDELLTKAGSSTLTADEKMLLDGIWANRANVANKPAAEFFNPLLKKYPKDDYLHLIFMFNTRDAKWNIQTGEAIVKRNPKFAPAFNLLGYAYMQENNLSKAEAAFNKYISLRPELANPYDSKGDYMMRVENYKEAASLYEKAASLGMKDSKVRGQRASARIKYGTLTTEDNEAIKKTVSASIDEYAKGNVDAFCNYYSDQSMEIFGNQMVNVGKASIRKRSIGMFKGGAITKLNLTISSVGGIGQIALAKGTYEWDFKPTDGEVDSDKGNAIYLLRKEEGTWKVLADHFYTDASAEGNAADVASIRQVLGSWNGFAKQGEVITAKNLDALGNLYSAQAIEINSAELANVGIGNLKTRWEFLLDAKFEVNNLGAINVETMGKRGVAWGLAVQHYYPKGSDKLREVQFPWAMIFTKEKDDVWRILVVHWYTN